MKVSVIDLKKNDKFSQLKGADLAELICELELCPLGLRKQLGLCESTRFGMEIEFEDARVAEVTKEINSIAPNWETKHDGTCDGEVVSPILKDTPQTYKELAKVCLAMKNLDAKALNCAGGHIHIGSQIVAQDFKALLNFLKTWTAYEKVFYRFAYGDKIGARKNITYAEPIGETLRPRLKHFARLDYMELRRQLPEKRYSAVNFTNFSGRGHGKDTIEFRVPNWTINPVVWQNNLNLFGKLLSKCKSENFNSEVVDKKLRNFEKSGNFYKATNNVNLQDAVEVCDTVFDKNIDKAYFLKQYVKFFKEPQSVHENMNPYAL
jgi:hypothetical protein